MSDYELVGPQKDKQVAATPPQESPAVAGVSDIKFTSDKIKRLEQDLTDERIEVLLEDHLMSTQEELTAEQMRERVQSQIDKTLRQREKLVTHYGQLEAQGKMIGKRYANELGKIFDLALIPADSVESLKRMARGDRKVWQTNDELSNMSSYQELQKLEPAERATGLSEMADTMVAEPDKYGVSESQFGRMTNFLPKEIQMAMFKILATEGEHSMVKKLRSSAQELRDPSAISKEDTAKDLEADWVRTQAIAQLLRSAYPELAKA